MYDLLPIPTNLRKWEFTENPNCMYCPLAGWPLLQDSSLWEEERQQQRQKREFGQLDSTMAWEMRESSLRKSTGISRDSSDKPGPRFSAMVTTGKTNGDGGTNSAMERAM